VEENFQEAYQAENGFGDDNRAQNNPHDARHPCCGLSAKLAEPNGKGSHAQNYQNSPRPEDHIAWRRIGHRESEVDAHQEEENRQNTRPQIKANTNRCIPVFRPYIIICSDSKRDESPVVVTTYYKRGGRLVELAHSQ
jgi:hypothetical protein